MKRPPSGEQFELASGDWRLTVVEVSGGMRTLRNGDWDVLDGYALESMCGGGRGQPLIPWPNRIDHGRYTFDARPYQLALTEPLAENAIHGLTRWSHWRVAERDEASVVMAYELDPQPGYPFALDLRLRYELSPDGLTVRTKVTNATDARCPFGVGFHPYFSCGDRPVDSSRLQVPADEYLATNARGIPTGHGTVDGTTLDFRQPRPIGALPFDHAFAALQRDRDGRAWVELSSADERRHLAIWLDETYDYVQVFTGDTLPEAERRRSVAVEPLTCPPNAFASGDGVHVLEPGASWQCAWGLRLHRPSRAAPHE
jgi:aldose 1-epimerase